MRDIDFLPPFLRRVRVRNYKSIGVCDLSLRPLTVVVGRNGSGKSNFLDALQFVTDSLRTSLDHAIQSRGGVIDVRRRSTGHPRNFAMEVEIGLPGFRFARYGFEIGARKDGGFTVKIERLQIVDGGNRTLASFLRQGVSLTDSSVERMPPILEDRLYLVNAAGIPEFRPVYDALLAMGFYNLNPEAIKELQSPDAGDLLHSDGGNLASVIARLSSERPETMERIRTYLTTIIPEITRLERVALGPKETLQFWQRVEGAEHPWRFYASSMSDGTLRALGALVAVMQITRGTHPVRLVGIEEPETALHPAAAGALVDALREASSQTQILVTSHSPDLLDQIDLDRDGLLVVVAPEGTTRIAPADAASMEALRRHLYSPGELLRMDQLQPDPASLELQGQIELFADDLEVA
jgi:predicted ATPase